MRNLIAFPVLGLAVIFQSTIISHITLLGGFADLLLVLLAAWALQDEIESAWHWAVLTGLMIGFISRLPSFVPLLGYLASEFKIDGVSLDDTLLNRKPSPRSEYVYYYPAQLRAIRVGDWKLFVPHNELVMDTPGGTGGKRVPERSERIGLSLYNLRSDIAESREVASRHPEVVERLLLRIQKYRFELGDTLKGMVGREARPPAKL